MGEQLKVEGHTDLVRDINSQAIINTDSDAYARREELQKHKNKEMK